MRKMEAHANTLAIMPIINEAKICLRTHAEVNIWYSRRFHCEPRPGIAKPTYDNIAFSCLRRDEYATYKQFDIDWEENMSSAYYCGILMAIHEILLHRIASSGVNSRDGALAARYDWHAHSRSAVTATDNSIKATRSAHQQNKALNYRRA